MNCPLCGGVHLSLFGRDRRRSYWRCRACELVSVPPDQRPDPAEERAEYDRHENHPDDPGYRRFLGRLFEPLAERCPPPARGLDFGCGPGPALAAMGRERGYEMSLYDPLYADEASVLAADYDFITATEVVEHLHDPGRTLECLLRRLRPGGWLGLMTQLVINAERFATWRYKDDPTHVAFFSRQTLEWLARRHGLGFEAVARDAFLFRRPE
ncbi:Methyltransferase domain-containing protein [Thiohalospira halophila DSM 15071]|uniref:Methyltransferase domain-containing protein n=1 Tax=Thiohalospira halophila DSM 15071 TaxID=1123397 RepID=A0A1I1NN71_9GAMM|nr:class I SAM-dependent methyltransferase [Thiohalospira halophila]SFC99101.1 Methyltransferase domain-containing protein [Thiohalospira halophila DSM 15071]